MRIMDHCIGYKIHVVDLCVCMDHFLRIVMFQAVDQDEKKAIHYFIKEDSSGKFTIDERTGKLKTRQKLDYEKKHSYKLIVSTREASGKNKAQYSATVTVTVLVGPTVILSSFCHHGPKTYCHNVIIMSPCWYDYCHIVTILSPCW